MNENMKKIVNAATPAVCAVALTLSVVAFANSNAELLLQLLSLHRLQQHQLVSQ